VKNSAKTLAEYDEMKYNQPEEYWLLKRHVDDVEQGWISPMSDFGNDSRL
jgi:hypothetical protein